MRHIVVLMQENKTTDFYFPRLVQWGAVVKTISDLLTVPADTDQQHDRDAWVHYKTGDYQAVDV